MIYMASGDMKLYGGFLPKYSGVSSAMFLNMVAYVSTASRL
jgi:hypothetical protein